MAGRHAARLQAIADRWTVRDSDDPRPFLRRNAGASALLLSAWATLLVAHWVWWSAPRSLAVVDSGLFAGTVVYVVAGQVFVRAAISRRSART